jgi:hypothetical protein
VFSTSISFQIVVATCFEARRSPHTPLNWQLVRFAELLPCVRGWVEVGFKKKNFHASSFGCRETMFRGSLSENVREE